MDRELLLEIGCEELPAEWLVPLTRQLGERLKAQLAAFRIGTGAPIETFSTPRRLTAAIARISERQTDLEDSVSGPPVAAAFDAAGQPTAAATGFARRAGVEVSELQQIDTPRGRYLAYTRRERGKATVDVLPDVASATLRELVFPKQMRWDAWLDDGRGEFTFGRPIRWILFLHGGRVVPFAIRRSALAQTAAVQEVRSGAVTYGHRVLAGSGRAGRALKVRSIADYRAKLAEHFVLLDREERQARIVRDLDAHARRLGGRVNTSAINQSHLLQDVVDLVEYPAVVAGTFSADFLALPEEVLTTTMIHHQHYFPVVDESGRLLPAFLAVANIETDNARAISVNSERVLGARLRDAQFFWEADRRAGLDSRLARLGTLLFHKRLGSYRAKALRLERLAAWIAVEALGAPGEAEHARHAGRLAKADLVTDMVREFTELQGTMGGIYAKLEGLPEAVWKAISLQYLPTALEPNAPPTRRPLGEAAVSWAAVSVADKLDSVVGMFAAGERPTGTRDPFGVRRQAQGLLRVLVDLPELTGLNAAPTIDTLVERAEAEFRSEATLEQLDETERSLPLPARDEWLGDLTAFLADRLRFLFERRGFSYDEINAVLPADGPAGGKRQAIAPLDVRRRLEALREIRGSADFEALAVAFKRVKNITKDLAVEPRAAVTEAWTATIAEIADQSGWDPAERSLASELQTRAPRIEEAARRGDYRAAFSLAAGFRGAVDTFFTDVLVMHDNPDVRRRRLGLVTALRDLILDLADISEIAGESAAAPAPAS
jgi:glycyl-tRNA synthetase beta chain